MITAGAMPPPAHMVISATCLSCRSSSSSAVPTSSEPVAPMGWPSAMAPPLTLIFSRSMSRSRMYFSGHDGEGLVDLEQVDVAQRHARLGEDLAGGGHGRVQHRAWGRRRCWPWRRSWPGGAGRARWRSRGSSRAGPPHRRRRPTSFRRGARGSISRPGNFCSTRERYVVPFSSSGMSASASKDEGSEASESAVVPGRGYSSRSRATVPSRLCTGTSRPVEAALLDGDLGPALRLRRQLVDGPAVDLLQRGDGVGGHALVRLGMDGAQVVVAAVEEGGARLARRWRRRTTSSRCRRR